MTSEPPPGSPAALENAIADRRRHLAATIDALSARAKPQALARRGVDEAVGRARSMVLTPDGSLRVERIGAVAGAAAVLLTLTVWLRRRR